MRFLVTGPDWYKGTWYLQSAIWSPEVVSTHGLHVQNNNANLPNIIQILPSRKIMAILLHIVIEVENQNASWPAETSDPRNQGVAVHIDRSGCGRFMCVTNIRLRKHPLDDSGST